MRRATCLSLILIVVGAAGARAETPTERLTALQLTAKKVRLAGAVSSEAALDEASEEEASLRRRTGSWTPRAANPRAPAICERAALALGSVIVAFQVDRNTVEAAALTARMERFNAYAIDCRRAITR